MRGGDGFFCSGADLSVLKKDFSDEDGIDMCYFMQATLNKLFRLDQISVALVDGMAIGGGTEVALSCDFRVFNKTGKFQMVQAQRGLSPGWGAGVKLVNLVGRQKALHVLCGGKVIEGDELLDYGIADVVTDQDIEESGLYLCRSFLDKGYTDAVKSCKKLIRIAEECSENEALLEEAIIFDKLWKGDSFKSTLSGFKSTTK